jgi:hypothetical protein
MKPTNIASGRVEDLLAAIANPKPAKPDQGQGARDMPGFAGDPLQGQQTREPMGEQPEYLRETGVHHEPPTGAFPEQAPDAGQDELIPSIVPSAPPGSRKP